MTSIHGDLVGAAKANLRSSHDFIAHDSSHYAKKVEDIAAKTDILDDLPRMGRVVPEIDNEHIWELSPYSYRILYEFTIVRPEPIYLVVNKYVSDPDFCFSCVADFFSHVCHCPGQ